MRKTCLLLLFVLLFGLSVAAQDTVTGAFEGTVTNSQTGEPVANAIVEIGNRETGQRIAKNANARGRFYQGLLAPGIYAIRVTANGYLTREVEQRLFVTRTGEVVPVPVALDPAPPTPLPGATPALTPAATPLTAQQTQVRAETNLVDAQRTGSFPDGTVDALPLGGTTITRSFDELTLFLPGVTLPPPTYGNGSGPGQGPGVGSAGQFAINGLRSRGNNFTVDGSDNNDEDIGVRRQGFFALIPQSIESVREYQTATLLPSAVFGRNLAGQVNAVSRSGGKDFHGTVYGFFNSSRLNARNSFDSANGNGSFALRADNLPVVVAPQVVLNQAIFKTVPVNGQPLMVRNGSGGKDSLTFIQSGVTFSGPVKRDRAFFFFSQEGQILNATQEGNFIVPTVRQRGVRGSGASGLFRNPFPGATPDGAFAYPTTHQGDAIFSLYPFPNNPDGPFGENTFTQTLPASARGAIVSGKYDQNFTFRERPQTFTARYNFTQDRRILPYTGGAIFSTLVPRVRAQNLSLFLNSELGAGLFNQARISYGRTRLVFDALPDRAYLQPSRLFPNDPFLLNAPLFENFTLPDFAAQGDNNLPNTGPVIYRRVAGMTTEGASINDLGPVGQVFIAGFSPVGYDVFNFPQRRVNNTYQLADTLTLRADAHTFAFGYDGRRSELNSDLPRNSRPMVAFQGAPQLVRTPLNATDFTFRYSGDFMSPIDLAAAAAASGFFQVLNTGTDAGLNLRFYQHNLFFQDDWRIRRNLSFSLGLRYEYNTPVTEAGRRVENSFNDPALNLAPGLRSFIGGRTRIYEPDFNNFGPRLGLAYAPRNDTVIRAGYGIYYDQILGAVVSQSRNVFPRFVNVNVAGGVGNAFALQGAPLNLLNPALSNLVEPGTLNRLNPGIPLATHIQQINIIASAGNVAPGASGIEATLPARNLRAPYAHQFSFSVERQIGFNLSLSAAYVGTVGNNLLRFTTPNLGPDAVLLPFAFFTAQSNQNLNFQPQFRGIALPPGARITDDGRIVGGRPVPGVGGLRFFETSATSYYHGLQLQARGRLADALRFQAHYTLSRAIDDVSDVFDLAGAVAYPQNSLTFAGERSRANFDSRHRFAYYFIYDVPSQNALLRDLQFSGTGQFQTGTPFTINSWTDVNMDGNITDRLDTLQGLVFTGDRSQPIRLNADPRSLLARIGEDGSIPRNFFRTSNFLDLNLALTKGLRVGERQRILLRVEVFNFINRPNFGVPGRYIEGPEFGQALNTLTPARRLQFVIKYLF